MTDPMIVEFVSVSQQGSDLFGFLISIAETAIGALLGFLLGLAAFWFQARHEESHEEEKDHRAQIDALRRLYAASWLNLEALAMIKMQLLDDLRPEVERMRTLVEKAYADDKEIKAIANTSMQFHRFYQGMPEVSIMPAPGFAEFSGVAVDMPALTTFVHRAMSSMDDLNARISSRNHLISDHAKENGGDGLSSIRLLYFASMLSDEGNNCVEIAENAMAFFVLVRDQLDNYFTHGIRLEGFTSYIFPDEVQKRLPKEERFPKLREQFRDFAAHPLSH